MPLVHFLLAYDHKRETLVADPQEFTDADEAATAYAQLESKYRDDPNVEIVLVGADSIETIKQTHGNYFNGSKPAASRYLTGV
jgi:hypothetical protein